MTICSIVDWGGIKFLYKILNIFGGKNRFSLHIIPSDLDTLFDIFLYMSIPCQMLMDCQT